MLYVKEYNPRFYSIPNLTIDNINDFYQKLAVSTKNDILAVLPDHISSKCSTHLSKDKLIEYFLDTTNLSINHDREWFDDNDTKWILETTTGSTGRPFTVLKSPSEKLVESKYLFDKRKSIYSKTSIKNGFLLLEPVDSFLKNLSYRGNNDENMPVVFQYLLEKKPSWILLTTLLLRKLYKYITESKQLDRLKQLDIKFIETTSQALYPEEKREIESAFNSKIIDQFGCKEVWNIAYECKDGHLHVNDQYLIVDLIDENGRLIEEEGQTGQVVLTSCLHKSFPIVKYYLGDYAEIKLTPCSCGQTSPRIYLKGGRDKDRLINSKFYGTEIFRKLMRFIYFKYPQINLGKIKIIQTTACDLNVYAEIDRSKQEQFIKIFTDTLNFLIENSFKYNIIFHYHYPFNDDPYALKEEIFENRIFGGKK